MGRRKQLIDWLEWGGIILLVYSLPLSESLKNIGFGLAALGFILKRIMDRGQGFRFYPFGWGLVAFFAASLITSIFAGNTLLSLKGSWDIFRYSFVFLIVANDMTSWKKAIIIGLVVSITLGGIWGIYNVIVYERPQLQILSLGHFNHTGIYLSMMFSTNIALLLSYRFMQNYLKIGLIVSTAIVLVALVMTTSRGSFVGLFFALLLISFALRRWKGLAVVVVIIGLSISGAYLSDSFRQKLWLTDSMKGRVEIWKNGYKAFLEHPIVGTGLNHFSKIDFKKYNSPQSGVAPHAHNLYVNVAAQGGLLGLFSLLFLFMGFLKTWLSTRDWISTDFEKAVLYGSMGTFLIVIFTGIFNTTLHHEHAMLFSIMTALLSDKRADKANIS